MEIEVKENNYNYFTVLTFHMQSQLLLCIGAPTGSVHV